MEQTKLPLADIEEQEESPPFDTINEEQSLPAEQEESPTADTINKEQSLFAEDQDHRTTYITH